MADNPISRMWRTFRAVAQFDTFEPNPDKRRLKRIASIEDYRRVAKRRLPGGVFDYIDGAAEDERTKQANADGFDALEWRPQILRDVSSIDTTTTLLGQPLSMPLVVAPTGYTRIAHSQGELAVARAAERAGVPYALSTMGTRSIEDVAGVSDGNKWFQVYMWRDRGLVRELIERSAAAGYTTLWLTVDTAVLGRRERDVRRGFELPPRIGPRTLIDGAVHPAWTIDFLRNDPIVFANLVNSSVPDGSEPIALAKKAKSQFDQSMSWDSVEWLRSIWDGPIALKGIQTVGDAKQAVALGVQGVGLSNHGGRQLDHAPIPIELVEPVRQEIQDQGEIICDGGVRRGGDIVKALALGADAVSIGRPYLYALGAAGELGVDHLLTYFREGLERTMALTGVRSLAEIDRSLVAWKR
ncbi:MAG: alpha-hydroxy acid oxidase [Actinomycetota bacterium]